MLETLKLFKTLKSSRDDFNVKYKNGKCKHWESSTSIRAVLEKPYCPATDMRVTFPDVFLYIIYCRQIQFLSRLQDF